MRKSYNSSKRELGLLRVSMLQEREGEKSKNVDKNLELVKIQVFSERTHARLAYTVSTTYTILIGFVVVFFTLFYQKVLSLEAFGVSIVPLLAGTIYEIYRLRRGYRRELKEISDMIETVKEGKELPRLEELVNR